MANLNRFPPPIVIDIELPVNYNNTHWSIRQKVREQYIKEQDGLCYHCQRSLYEEPYESIINKIDKCLFPKNFFTWPIHLHHSHVTGLTLGAVHSYCNAVLWQFYGE